MDFIKESLSQVGGVSIHFSSDCNIACKYCYIEKDKKCMASYNRDIRQSLEDGSFAAIIKQRLECIKDQIDDLSLWGAEPTINSKLFKNFIYELLDFFPNVHSLMFSTNAILGDVIFDDFLIPLYEYAEQHQREITFKLQMSLDGPPEFNDDSRHPGATASTLKTMTDILTKCPAESDYFKLEISTKTTLDVSYMRQMIEGGIEKFQWYYDFFDKVIEDALVAAGDKHTINIQVGSSPTLVDPGYHTVEDGKTFAKWVRMLPYVDRSHFKHYTGPLFMQPLGGIENLITSYNPLADAVNVSSCSASKNNISIDHEGNFYTCNRLCRNAALGGEAIKKHAMQSNSSVGLPDKKWLKHTYGSYSVHENILTRKHFIDSQIVTLAEVNQIDPKYVNDSDARLLLFFLTLGVSCHIGAEEDYTQNPFVMPFSYLRLFGNGALEAMLDYYKLEVLRGNMRPWKIVM